MISILQKKGLPQTKAAAPDTFAGIPQNILSCAEHVFHRSLQIAFFPDVYSGPAGKCAGQAIDPVQDLNAAAAVLYSFLQVDTVIVTKNIFFT